MNSLEYREAKKNCFCRGCDVELEKGTKMIATYSFRNRGQHIYFCIECVKEMNGLIYEEEFKQRKK